jgi:hypothetical protein
MAKLAQLVTTMVSMVGLADVAYYLLLAAARRVHTFALI